VRALAVAAVLAYHLSLGWASGGYLGVDLFFVLSGFLITSLLLEEWVTTGTIGLGAFWARRARRLLPALFLVLLAIGLFVVVDGRFGPPGAAAGFDLSGLRGDALATLFYVANWHAVFAHQSYFAHFTAPSPLGHTWSLAIEEQFYLIWPPVLLLLLPRIRRHWRRTGALVTAVGALASAVLMALLFHPGQDPSRLYFGTDTHAFDMLAGATVAMLAAARTQPGPRATRLLHAAGPLAAVALGCFWVLAGSAGGYPKAFMFRGGFLLCALLAAVMIADVRLVDAGPLARLLALAPLRWIGMISYGIYLWHFPIFTYLTQGRTGLSGAGLDLAKVGLTLAVATASFYLVERPIRCRDWSHWPRVALVPLGFCAMAGVVVAATAPAVASPPAPTLSKNAVAPARAGAAVPGAGGLGSQRPVALGFTPSAARPLRVMFLGDSVMFVSEPGLDAALAATGAVTTSDNALDGFGLSPGPGVTIPWRRVVPQLIAGFHPDLIVATWGWDDGPPRSPNAVQEPAAYTRELNQALDLMLTPGNGVKGVVFLQYPPSGPVLAATKAAARTQTRQRTAGQVAWQRIVERLPAQRPGQVLYLPVGPSILLHGTTFSPWLPPTDDPSAPARSWVRVRMVDDVHLCPPGVTRYADAVLTDLTGLFHLPAATPGWWDGAWIRSDRYNTPAGSCPDDHPPG
jgi:peptidoglycan/LPS O-acetylase OafA/YrhL